MQVTQPAIDAILFDLGGVLVEFDGIESLIALNGRITDAKSARRFWLTSPAVCRFEVGGCTPEEFAAGAVAELGLALEPDYFLKEFQSWDRGPMDGALVLLDELRPHYRLACLSNNNEMHWGKLCEETELPGKFYRCYLSHELGLIKPGREVFDTVVRDLAVEPQRILYFDDNPECVEGARRAGLSAYVARGVEEVRAVLCELGMLPGD